MSRCPWARDLTLTAPDELAVAMHGAHFCRCVNVCTNGWKLGNVVKRLERPLVRKALYKCQLQLTPHLLLCHQAVTRSPSARTLQKMARTGCGSFFMHLLTLYLHGCQQQHLACPECAWVNGLCQLPRLEAIPADVNLLRQRKVLLCPAGETHAV